MLVCVALRQRRTGADGEREPKVLKMSDCSAANFCSAISSACWLRETLMSTMLPEWMSGGRRMEGNSICDDAI
jgi:hypothetical protein